METEDSSSADIKQKSKKPKKRKAHCNDETESSPNDVIQSDIPTATCDSLTTCETKKKKKKTKKHQEDVVGVCANGDGSVAMVAEDSVHKDKKSAKKRKHSSDMQGTNGTGGIPDTTADDSSKQIKTADGNDHSLHFLSFVVNLYHLRVQKMMECVCYWTYNMVFVFLILVLLLCLKTYEFLSLLALLALFKLRLILHHSLHDSMAYI